MSKRFKRLAILKIGVAEHRTKSKTSCALVWAMEILSELTERSVIAELELTTTDRGKRNGYVRKINDNVYCFENTLTKSGWTP